MRKDPSGRDFTQVPLRIGTREVGIARVYSDGEIVCRFVDPNVTLEINSMFGLSLATGLSISIDLTPAMPANKEG